MIIFVRPEERAARHKCVLELSVSVSDPVAAVSIHGAAVERSREDDEEKEGVGGFHGAQWNRIATG